MLFEEAAEHTRQPNPELNPRGSAGDSRAHTFDVSAVRGSAQPSDEPLTSCGGTLGTDDPKCAIDFYDLHVIAFAKIVLGTQVCRDGYLALAIEYHRAHH